MPAVIFFRHCLGYVYESLLEKALDEFKVSHRIRKNRLSGCPSGIPDDLYTLPEINGTHVHV